jgi:hypothetical protein
MINEYEKLIEGIKQVTKEEAIAIFDSELWKNWSNEEKVKVQLFQKRLLMPFPEFHKALEKVLGRSIWTHELVRNISGIFQEYYGLKGKPTIQEIFNLINK